jgi:hypothetical protein
MGDMCAGSRVLRRTDDNTEVFKAGLYGPLFDIRTCRFPVQTRNDNRHEVMGSFHK